MYLGNFPANYNKHNVIICDLQLTPPDDPNRETLCNMFIIIWCKFLAGIIVLIARLLCLY